MLFNHGHYALEEMFDPPRGAPFTQTLGSNYFTRTHRDFNGKDSLLLDTLPDSSGASCCFARLSRGSRRVVQFTVRGLSQLELCPSGGWLLKSVESTLPSFWIPVSPTLRMVDAHGRIVSEESAVLLGSTASSRDSTVSIGVPDDLHLDLTLWRLPPEASDVTEALRQPVVLEQQAIILGSSHTAFRCPADVYRCLIHGHVYDNRFVWRARGGGFKWRICSENEAYSLYVALHGLELATKRRLHRLLKRQILFSVIARQSEDGGWHHGEWTDLMESHFRLHSAGMRILETALEERPDDVVADALRKAAGFLSKATDKTAIGTWFLHDSLEQSVQAMTARGAPRWKPSRTLGKSTTNKLILNTHLDSIVVLDRYREITGDQQYDELVASARSAACTLLALRPAEPLYRAIFRAVGLTLLPASKARQLPLTLRIAERLTRKYLIPQMHRIKRMFPRMVMPGGLIERHLAPRYWDVGYHPVNVMDLARMFRRFPDGALEKTLREAVEAVTRTDLLAYWVERKRRQALGYWVAAMYHMCTLDPAHAYRGYLAESILGAHDAGLGLPPSLLGGDSEVVRHDQQVPCPSPGDPRLRVASLSCKGCREILVVNCAAEALELDLDADGWNGRAWIGADGCAVADVGRTLQIGARHWLVAQQRQAILS